VAGLGLVWVGCGWAVMNGYGCVCGLFGVVTCEMGLVGVEVYASGGGSRMRATSPKALNRPVRPINLSSSRVRSRSDKIAVDWFYPLSSKTNIVFSF
jgi:hypothetical protein